MGPPAYICVASWRAVLWFALTLRILFFSAFSIIYVFCFVLFSSVSEHFDLSSQNQFSVKDKIKVIEMSKWH